MKIQLKNYKPCQNLSEETLAFTATIWIDGKRAGECSNRGHGDPIAFYFKDRELEKRFYAYCESLPPLPLSENPADWEVKIGPLPMNAELFIGDLCEKMEQERWLKRQTRNKVLFRLDDTKPGSYMQVTLRGTGHAKEQNRASVKARLNAMYGEKLVEVLG